jgi:hypothetical protein
MDLVANMGWRNRADPNRGTTHMVRDAFMAADAMHQAAMAGMEVSTGDDSECSGNMERLGDETAALNADDSMDMEASRQGEFESDPGLDG